MKKTYFNPALMQKRYAPKIGASRFKYLMNNSSRAYKDEGGDTATADTDADKLIARINTQVQKDLASRASKAELLVLEDQIKLLKELPIAELRSIVDAEKGAMAVIAAQGLELTRLEARLQAAPKDMSVRSQVAAWQEANKDSIGKIIAGEKINLPVFDLDMRVVASPMTPATVNATNSPYIGRVEVEPGINDFLRAAPTFWDFITKGRTNAPTYVWVNKTNPQGAAAFIGPGVPKPGISFELVAETSIAKKIADSAKAATELLQDIDGMTTFIEQELRYQVMIKVNSTLMVNAGSSTVPKGIQNYSVLYTLSSIKTTNANYMDAIRAVIAQMRAGYLTGPITVFINPIDAANMDLSKAVTSGVYLLPPFVTANGLRIAGAQIVEDYSVPIGYFQAAYLRFYRILIYKDFTVSWGWENDDFTRNLVTAVGEMRLHQFVNSIYANSGAFVYDTFANVVTALNTP